MKKKILVLAFVCLFVCLLCLSACSNKTENAKANSIHTEPETDEIAITDENAVNDDTEDYEQNEYEAFLSGETSASFNGTEYDVSELLESDTGEYLYCDIDGDGQEELNIRSEKVYYIVKQQKSELKVIYEGSAYEQPISGSSICGVLYYRAGDAPKHDTYQFQTFQEDGTLKDSISFEWYDDNENQEMDDEDSFTWNEEEISMSEWEESTKIYLDSKDMYQGQWND